MGLDIRIPIGLLFTILGIILAAFGLASAKTSIYQRSLGINLNLEWGIVLVAFGLAMLFFGRRSGKDHSSEQKSSSNKASKGHA